MTIKRILRWVARGALLFLSFCGIATLVTHYTNPVVSASGGLLEVAWVFGVGGLILFLASFFGLKSKG